jgi:hypothetical protein
MQEIAVKLTLSFVFVRTIQVKESERLHSLDDCPFLISIVNMPPGGTVGGDCQESSDRIDSQSSSEIRNQESQVTGTRGHGVHLQQPLPMEASSRAITVQVDKLSHA